MPIDLHIHTSASDGNIEPEAVLFEAKSRGLKTVAFADHETTAGYERVIDLAAKINIELISGIELQAWHRNSEVHLLGYLLDYQNVSFQKQLAELRKERNLSALDMVEKINSYGFNITWEQVAELSKLGGPISKGHIMQVLRINGYINSKEDAIEIMGMYLNQEGKAYTCRNFSVVEAIELVRKAGGIPVLAHPGLIGDDDIVKEIIGFGIEGLEVYYYYFGSRKDMLIQKYAELAKENKLLMTGGSDYHGTITPVILGELVVPEKVRTDLLNKNKF